MDANRNRYTPTKGQILAACKKIQEKWDPTTRNRRAVQPSVPWELPLIKISDDFVLAQKDNDEAL